MNLLWKSC